jgi:hypothetical protein
MGDLIFGKISWVGLHRKFKPTRFAYRAIRSSDTNSNRLYALTYSGGPGTIAAPYFNWDHVCHSTPPGCANDHGYNDGFAHFIYDGVVQRYSLGYIGSPGLGNSTTGLFIPYSFRRTLGVPFPSTLSAEGQEDQVYPIFKKIVELRSIAHLRLLMAGNPLNTGIVNAWSNNLRDSISLVHQTNIREEAYDLYINLP